MTMSQEKQKEEEQVIRIEMFFDVLTFVFFFFFIFLLLKNFVRCLVRNRSDVNEISDAFQLVLSKLI